MKQKIKVIYILLLFYGFSTLFASTNKSNKLVAEAWEAWADNDQQLVEQKFMAAIAEDQNNTRAYLGLSFLYNLQYKFDQAWTTYEKVLQIEKNIYPYIFAAWATDRMRDENYTMKSQTVAFLEKLSQQADNAGILKAMANEVLGKYYQQKGDFSKAKRYYENMNSVTEWTVIGPFDNISASGFDKVFPPELEYDVTKTYAGKNSVPASWFKVEKIRNDYWIDFRRYFAFFESVYYANTFVYSPKKQSIQIRIGTSGSLKAFLNDALIVQAFDELNNGLDTYVVETDLQEGWNRLLIKCGYSEIKQCNFMVRLTDAEGEVLAGLKVSTESQPYESTSNIPVKVIENFAEAFFKQKIKAHPERLENYLLLADCLLRNDKANAAELVLRDAIQLSPNCALLYHHILEAYRRGHKYDELATTVEKIYTLDNLVPYVLEYKILTYFDNQEVGRAEELLKKLEKLLPQSALVYELYLALYDKKNLVDKMRETSSQAYNQFPANWTFAYWEAYNSIQLTQKCNRAIEIITAFLKQKLTLDALTTLADVYLRSANIEKWQEMYHKALAVDPAATGFYFQMAKTYFALQDYDHAEEAIKKGLAICPNSPHFWYQLGEIYRVKNKIDLARQAFHEVLNYEPTSYKAREVLRELEGKNSIFAQFETVDIDSLRAAASDSDEYEENGAVILLHDAKSVVYGRGASESIEEILVKVFNNRGIDAVKEYWISYNAYSQELIVEKAVVIKSDGSEINADIDVNHIVFKSLEANDFIYLKWKLKNFYSGKLANHFWDTFYFNAYYPAKMIRYALLVPNNFSFNYQTQNMQVQPTKKQTEKDILYQWSLNDEPAIAYEYYMPGLTDVGKMLYISSIEDWGY
ncbi:MAG: tetratricopeptide repeat protein, partial [bacterium]